MKTTTNTIKFLSLLLITLFAFSCINDNDPTNNAPVAVAGEVGKVCADERLYIGCTEDVEKRVGRHQNGSVLATPQCQGPGVQ
jgi:hypothetical protein